MAESMEGKTATELLAMGTKAYLLNKYTDAAAYLSRSSEMFVEEHKDDKHNSLGNVYLLYGKALLEIARRDGNPLGDAVPKEVGVEEEASDEEDEVGMEAEVEGEEDDAEGEEAEEKKAGEGDEEKKDGDAEEKAKDKEEENKTDGTKVANISINGEAASSTAENGDDSVMETEEEGDAADEGGEDDGEGGSAEKTEEEEPTDLQLAWEVLELAKIILERRGDAGKEDYADCLITLGEVSLESENFDSAIADIKSGVELQKSIFTESKDMRKLAESYYKLGMALAANNKPDEGIENYQKTLEILKERMKVLEELEEPGSSDLDEIKEMKDLIPEMEEKIEDLKVYKEEAGKKVEEEQPVVSSPEKKVNNITHLVKRKRKLEEVAEEAAKKASS